MNNQWIKSGPCLYRYGPSGTYHARVRFGGKLYRRSLDTIDFAFAKRKLAEFRASLGRTDPRQGNISFGAVLDRYALTLGSLKESTRKKKLGRIAKLKRTWHGIDALPLRVIRPSDIAAWLSRHCPQEKSASTYNQNLTLIRDALQLAVDDRVIADSPAKNLKWRNPPKNVLRPTPTFEEFRKIVADVKSKRFNPDADDSADFIEFLGLAGLGQAEARSITRGDVDLEKGTIRTFRHKTSQGFAIPIYPQVVKLIKRLCKNKAHNERLLAINDARKALMQSCRRLGFANYTQRSLRRMFVVKGIEAGIDVKVLAQWQGHRDGGQLILKTYSHVRPLHSQRMARLMR